MTVTMDFASVPRDIEFSASEGIFYASNSELNATAEGKTEEEAAKNFELAVSDLFEFCLDEGIAIPSALVSTAQRELAAG